MASIKKRATSRGDRYDARLRVGGREVSKTFTRRRDAEQWSKLMEADRVLGVAVDPGAGRVKFADYADDWVSSRQLAPRTVELYSDLRRRMIDPSFGQSPIGKIGPEAVRRWNKALVGERGPMQAAKAYRLLRAVLNTAAADGLIAKNPCRIPGAGQEHSPERPIVTPDVVLDLAEAIEPRYSALILLAAFGGLRRGELLGLRRRNVDLEAGSVSIETQVVILADEGRRETAPKTQAGRRTVAVPAVVVGALAEHLDRYSEPGPDGFVFTGEKGRPLVSASLYPAFNAAKKKAKVDDGVTLHDLRHTAGTLAAWTGATTKELMARLGHSSSRAALRYQHAAEARDRDIADRLDVLVASTNRRPKAAVVPIVRDGRGMENDEAASQ
jgi:integrase